VSTSPTRGDSLHSYGIALATPKEEEKLENWYRFICSYPLIYYLATPNNFVGLKRDDIA